MNTDRRIFLNDQLEIKKSVAHKANQLRRAGLSIFQVSRALQTNPIQVARWVGENNVTGARP